MSVSLCLALMMTVSDGAPTGDWTHWRGPTASGEAPGNPPATWSETENVKWKVEIPGKGTGTPIILGDRIYLTTAVSIGKPPETAPPGEEGEGDRRRGGRRGGRGGFFGRGGTPPVEHEFLLMALDRSDGSVIWKKSANKATPHAGTHPDGSFASASVVTDGEQLFAHFGSNGLYAFTMDGEPLWNVDLGDMTVRGTFGEGSSPAVHGDVLVVNWDHEAGSFIVALNKETGEELWRKPRVERSGWATPIIVDHDGSPQVIVNAKTARSYDLETGELLWETGGNTDNVIPTAIYHDGMVYLASGFRGAALQAVELDAIDDTEAEPLWRYDADMPYVPSLALSDGVLYALKGNSGMLTAIDAESGEAHYGPERLGEVSNVYASPIVAQGRLYIVGRDGGTAVVATGPEFEVLHVNQLDEGCDASPAVVGDELFLRGRKHLYCIAED